METTSHAQAHADTRAARPDAPPPPTPARRDDTFDRVASRLYALCLAAGFAGEAGAVVADFRRLVSPWATRRPAVPPGWVSEISDDHTPAELSITLRGDRTEVRALFEPQAVEPSLAAFRAEGLAFFARAEREFGADLARFRQVEDLFLPDAMQGAFAVWSSVVFSAGQRPQLKAYFNPQARGPAHAEALVDEALARLGLPRALAALRDTALRRGPALDELKYFALDLTAGPEARVKLYVRHHAATAEDLERAASAASGHVPGSARAFVRAMRGGDEPCDVRAPFTCSAFTTTARDRPAAATVYVPVCAYARDDAAALERVRGYLAARDAAALARYEAIVRGYADRPLEAGVGMQAWVASRTSDGGERLSAYFATESRGVFAPGTVPAPSHTPAPDAAPVAPPLAARPPTLTAVMDRLEQRMADYEKRPLMRFLRDPQIDPRDKLRFAPHVAHFVMTFGDLCRYLLPTAPPADRFQELVNANAREDRAHWRWFLDDLAKLDADPRGTFSDAVRLIWSERTVCTRMLSYQLCALAVDADPLHKLVLVEAIEGAFKATVRPLGVAAGVFTAQTGRRLAYLGARHSDAESSHTLEDTAVRRDLREVPLSPALVDSLCAVVDRCFALFGAFADEMLELAQRGP